MFKPRPVLGGSKLHLNFIYHIILFLSLSVASAGAATLPPAFQKGNAAFEKGDYQSALKQFKEAELSGLNTSALHYNLGVCYYKLKDYPYAEKYFTLAANDKRMTQLAQYNLGLTASRMNDQTKALSWFKQATTSGNDAKITALANQRLAKPGAAQQTDERRVRGGGSFALGRDDNVNLIAADLPSLKSDSYKEGSLYVNIPLSPAFTLSGSAYMQDYNTVNTADFSQLGVDLSYAMNVHSWHLTPTVGLSQSDLNGDDYQSLMDFKFSAKRALGDGSNILLRYRYTDINSDNTIYNYLEGDRQQLRVHYKQPSALGLLSARYELELNSRQNTPTANYSPTRHDFRLRLEQTTNTPWRFLEELQYRDSQYDAAAGVTREDKRKVLLLEGSRKLHKQLSLGVRYSHTDNDSNVTTKAYSRDDIQLYTDFSF